MTTEMNVKERADRVDLIKDFIVGLFIKHDPKFSYSGEWGGFLKIHLFGISGLHGLDEIEKAIKMSLETTHYNLSLFDIKIITQSFDARDSLNGKSDGCATMICHLGNKEAKQ